MEETKNELVSLEEEQRNEKEEQTVETHPRPSSFSEFADCFLFFKRFGDFLSLPDVTLLDLERFFQHGDVDDHTDPIVIIHYQLLCNVTRRPIDMENWMFVGAKLAYSNGSIEGTSDYEDFDLHKRIQLCKFLCEIQFDRNSSFKTQLAKLPDDDDIWRETPVGLDQKGLRYWFLQDSTFNLRLYSEDKYLEYPFDHPKWTLLCYSLEQLKVFVTSMEKGHHHDDKGCDDTMETTTICEFNEDDSNGRKRKKRMSLGKNKRKKDQQKTEGGCMVCQKDTYYSKMLLCDKCDKECHTYCQYPIVWTIPEGEWFCPFCRELLLIQRLKDLYKHLVESLLLYEQKMEEEQKKLKRLQRGGLLIQNIISEEHDIDEYAPRRSGRSKKDINYAELNEVNIHHIPTRPSRVTFAVPSTFYSTRRSRQTITMQLEEPVSECKKEEGKESKSCQLEVITVVEQQNTDCIYQADNVVNITESNEPHHTITEVERDVLLCSFPLDALSCVPSLQSSQSLSPTLIPPNSPKQVSTCTSTILLNESEHNVHSSMKLKTCGVDSTSNKHTVQDQLTDLHAVLSTLKSNMVPSECNRSTTAVVTSIPAHISPAHSQTIFPVRGHLLANISNELSICSNVQSSQKPPGVISSIEKSNVKEISNNKQANIEIVNSECFNKDDSNL